MEKLNHNEVKQQIEEQIKINELQLRIILKVIPILREMDGKQLNKRTGTD